MSSLGAPKPQSQVPVAPAVLHASSPTNITAKTVQDVQELLTTIDTLRQQCQYFVDHSGQYSPLTNAPEPSPNLQDLVTVNEGSLLQHNLLSTARLLTDMASGERLCGDFERFRDLPLEIRLMIWKMALPGPRVIEVAYEYETLDAEKHLLRKDRQRLRQIIKANVPPPAVLHICKESRDEALSKFVRLSNETDNPDVEFCHVLFDPAQDTIFFNGFNRQASPRTRNSPFLNGTVWSTEALNRIQHLALDVQWLDIYKHLRDRASHPLRLLMPHLQDLKSLSIVVHSHKLGRIKCHALYERTHWEWRAKGEVSLWHMMPHQDHENLGQYMKRFMNDVLAWVKSTEQDNPLWIRPDLIAKVISRNDTKCCYSGAE